MTAKKKDSKAEERLSAEEARAAVARGEREPTSQNFPNETDGLGYPGDGLQPGGES